MTEFDCITKIYSGSGAISVLEQFSGQRVVIVSDKYFSQSGKAAEIGQRMKPADVRIFDEVQPDPSATLAAKGAALCQAFRPQLLIALGGGSAMDCAKGIKAAYDRNLKMIAIPTTSGSGSEVTSFSILTHNQVKHPLIDPCLRPDMAILDSDLLETLPSTLIADSGMDLLAHCLEALVSKNRNGFTDALAIYGARTVFSKLPASKNGDRSVRLQLHEAATMAGLAFVHAGLGVCHSLAHAIGGMYHVPHGRLCAILLPVVLEVNSQASLAQYAELARVCGLPGQTDRLALRNLQQAICRLRRNLDLPESMMKAGIKPEDFQTHERDIIQTARQDPCSESNPVPVTKELLSGILKAVYR